MVFRMVLICIAQETICIFAFSFYTCLFAAIQQNVKLMVLVRPTLKRQLFIYFFFTSKGIFVLMGVLKKYNLSKHESCHPNNNIFNVRQATKPLKFIVKIVDD